MEGNFTPQADIPDAYTATEPVKVVACEWVPDAYSALAQAEKEGKLRLKSYTENSEKTIRWLETTIQREYEQAENAPDYRRFLMDKFPFLNL